MVFRVCTFLSGEDGQFPWARWIRTPQQLETRSSWPCQAANMLLNGGAKWVSSIPRLSRFGRVYWVYAEFAVICGFSGCVTSVEHNFKSVIWHGSVCEHMDLQPSGPTWALLIPLLILMFFGIAVQQKNNLQVLFTHVLCSISVLELFFSSVLRLLWDIHPLCWWLSSGVDFGCLSGLARARERDGVESAAEESRSLVTLAIDLGKICGDFPSALASCFSANTPKVCVHHRRVMARAKHYRGERRVFQI